MEYIHRCTYIRTNVHTYIHYTYVRTYIHTLTYIHTHIHYDNMLILDNPNKGLQYEFHNSGQAPPRVSGMRRPWPNSDLPSGLGSGFIKG